MDILVNSAGVHTENADFFSMTSEEFDRVMNINIKGVYFTCKEFALEMKKKQGKDKKHILSKANMLGGRRENFGQRKRGNESRFRPAYR